MKKELPYCDAVAIASSVARVLLYVRGLIFISRQQWVIHWRVHLHFPECGASYEEKW